MNKRGHCTNVHPQILFVVGPPIIKDEDIGMSLRKLDTCSIIFKIKGKHPCQEELKDFTKKMLGWGL